MTIRTRFGDTPNDSDEDSDEELPREQCDWNHDERDDEKPEGDAADDCGAFPPRFRTFELHTERTGPR